MFPNVRLMIAALVASIVMLSVGFGVFAAFRVNHQPFGRLPNGSAPLQLAANTMGNTMGSTMGQPSLPLSAGPAFGPRFELHEAKIAGEETGAIAAAATDPGAAPPEPAPAIPTAEVAEQPLPDLAMAEEAGEPAAAPGAPATIDKPADQAAPVQQAEREAEPSPADSTVKTDDTATGVAVLAARARRVAARKAAAKQHVAAAAPHRGHKVRARTVVQASPQTATFGQQSFGAATAVPIRAVKLRRGAQTSAVGGPFVRPPAQ